MIAWLMHLFLLHSVTYRYHDLDGPDSSFKCCLSEEWFIFKNIFLILLGITKLDKEKNQCIRQKTGAQNIVKEIKQ